MVSGIQFGFDKRRVSTNPDFLPNATPPRCSDKAPNMSFSRSSIRVQPRCVSGKGPVSSQTPMGPRKRHNPTVEPGGVDGGLGMSLPRNSLFSR